MQNRQNSSDSPHIIKFEGEQSRCRPELLQRRLKRDWKQQKKNLLNTECHNGPLQVQQYAVEDLALYREYGLISNRCVKYAEGSGRTMFVSESSLQLRVEVMIQKDNYFDFSREEYPRETPTRYFSYNDVRCKACHKIGHIQGECQSIRPLPITNPDRRCYFCDGKGHSIDECFQYKQPLVEINGVLWRGNQRQGLIYPSDSTASGADIDY